MAERATQVAIGASPDGQARYYKVRPQTLGLERDLSELSDELDGLRWESDEISSRLNTVLAGFRAIDEGSENGGGNARLEALSAQGKDLTRRIREVGQKQTEVRIRMLARRLEGADPEELLSVLDIRRLDEIEDSIAGRPTPPTSG